MCSNQAGSSYLFGSARNSITWWLAPAISPDGFGISNILLAVSLFLEGKKYDPWLVGIMEGHRPFSGFQSRLKTNRPSDYSRGTPRFGHWKSHTLGFAPLVSMMLRWQDSFHFEYREFLLKFPASWYRWSGSLCFILAAKVFKSPKTVTPQHRNTTQGTPRLGELSFQPVHGKTRYSNSSRF